MKSKPITTQKPSDASPLSLNGFPKLQNQTFGVSPIRLNTTSLSYSRRTNHQKSSQSISYKFNQQPFTTDREFVQTSFGKIRQKSVVFNKTTNGFNNQGNTNGQWELELFNNHMGLASDDELFIRNRTPITTTMHSDYGE